MSPVRPEKWGQTGDGVGTDGAVRPQESATADAWREVVGEAVTLYRSFTSRWGWLPDLEGCDPADFTSADSNTSCEAAEKLAWAVRQRLRVAQRCARRVRGLEARDISRLIDQMAKQGLREPSVDARLLDQAARAELLRRLDRHEQISAAKQRPNSQPRRWSDDETELIAWFVSATIPSEPFQIDSARKVEEPALYAEALRRDIEAGPDGPRARTGALQRELQLLKTRSERIEQSRSGSR